MIQEVYVFLSAMASGFAAGFLYDLFRLKRKALKTKSFAVYIDDIVFWIITALIVFIAAYSSNQGEIRFYFFLAVTLGVSVYYWLFSRWVIQILTFTVKVLIWPIVFILKLMKPPARWVGRQITKGAGMAGKSLRITGIRLNRRFKSIRHIIQKL